MLIEIENYNKFGNRLFHFFHKIIFIISYTTNTL